MRPDQHLVNSETHSACMLLSVHKNSLMWDLYVGDRGVVDYFLSKIMIMLPFSGGVLSLWFKTAHYLQMQTKTSVAAHKGWDEVCMVIIMIISRLCNDHTGNSL